MILPIIMCSGNGSRLWPLSRSAFPKQFLPFNSSKILLQETVARLANLESEARLFICNK